MLIRLTGPLPTSSDTFLEGFAIQPEALKYAKGEVKPGKFTTVHAYNWGPSGQEKRVAVKSWQNVSKPKCDEDEQLSQEKTLNVSQLLSNGTCS